MEKKERLNEIPRRNWRVDFGLGGKEIEGLVGVGDFDKVFAGGMAVEERKAERVEEIGVKL